MRATCVALRDTDGALAVTLPDGTQGTAEVRYVPVAEAVTMVESIVWQPAGG